MQTLSGPIHHGNGPSHALSTGLMSDPEYIWTNNQNFGEPVSLAPPQEIEADLSQIAVIRLPWHFDLQVQDLPRWIPDTAGPLICAQVQSIDHILFFDPAAKLKYFHNTVCQFSQHCGVPQSCTPQHSIFHFIAYLHQLHPTPWA